MYRITKLKTFWSFGVFSTMTGSLGYYSSSVTGVDENFDCLLEGRPK